MLVLGSVSSQTLQMCYLYIERSPQKTRGFLTLRFMVVEIDFSAVSLDSQRPDSDAREALMLNLFAIKLGQRTYHLPLLRIWKQQKIKACKACMVKIDETISSSKL